MTKKPLIDPSLPRDPKTKQILDPKTSKPVGSSKPQFFEEIDLSGEHKRAKELEEQINEWRIRGQLWTEYDPDSHVTQALEEYDALQKKIHPQRSNPLSFIDAFPADEGTNGD